MLGVGKLRLFTVRSGLYQQLRCRGNCKNKNFAFIVVFEVVLGNRQIYKQFMTGKAPFEPDRQMQKHFNMRPEDKILGDI